MIHRTELSTSQRGPFTLSAIIDPFTGLPFVRITRQEQTLPEVLRTDAGIMWRQRRKRWSRLCTRAAEAISAGRSDPDLAVHLRTLAAFSEGKGRHGLASKLYAAATAVDTPETRAK